MSTALYIKCSMYEPRFLDLLDRSVIVTGHGLTEQVLESCKHSTCFHRSMTDTSGIVPTV